MATGEENKEYVCTLSEERLKQAEEELFETNETRVKGLKELREKIEACPGKWEIKHSEHTLSIVIVLS